MANSPNCNALKCICQRRPIFVRIERVGGIVPRGDQFSPLGSIAMDVSIRTSDNYGLLRNTRGVCACPNGVEARTGRIFKPKRSITLLSP